MSAIQPQVLQQASSHKRDIPNELRRARSSIKCKPFKDVEMTHTVEISLENLMANMESEVVSIGLRVRWLLGTVRC